MNSYRAVFSWSFDKAEGLPIEYWRIQTDGPRGRLYGMVRNGLHGLWYEALPQNRVHFCLRFVLFPVSLEPGLHPTAKRHVVTLT